MTRPYSNYLFHIPRIGDVVDIMNINELEKKMKKKMKPPHSPEIVDINELEKKMKTKYPPGIVHVIDARTKKRLGTIPPGIALLKYR